MSGLPVLILVEGHVLAVDDDVAHAGDADIAVALGVVFNSGLHIGRIVEVERALRGIAVGGDGETQLGVAAVGDILSRKASACQEQQYQQKPSEEVPAAKNIICCPFIQLLFR